MRVDTKNSGSRGFVARRGEASVGHVRLGDNAVDVLQNGREIFPAMLEAIKNAERSICFETYVYWSGGIAKEFAHTLATQARRGVRVHVLLDWYGCLRMSDELVDLMTEAGVDVEHYRPLKWYHFVRTNYRTHRKLLIVDGNIGFTGGVGIADEWTGDAQDPDHWRDNHYRFRGPVVRELQSLFFDNWEGCEREVPQKDDPAYYPPLDTPGDGVVSVCHSAPFRGHNGILRLYRNAFSSAQSRLDIATAYFVPGAELLQALMEAARRRVTVRILMCGPHIDQQLVRNASRAFWGKLLGAGVQLFEYQPTLLHAKLLIVDGEWVSVGSANLDARSTQLNDEVNVNLYQEEMVRRHVEMFERDLEHAEQVTLESWRRRPLKRKFKDAVCSLLRTEL